MRLGPLDASARRAAHDAFVAALAARPAPVRIVDKASVLHQQLADRALRILSFGGQTSYLTQYVTTLGHTIYVPEGWWTSEPGHRLAVLCHELVHVEQFERLGALGMVVLYGLLPLPMGLSWFRARLELEAYAVTLEATAEIDGLDAALDPALRAFIVERFVGPDYLFMWPFRRVVDGWIRALQEDLRRRAASGPLLGSEPRGA